MTPDEATLRDLIQHDVEILRLRAMKDGMQSKLNTPKTEIIRKIPIVSVLDEYRALKRQRAYRELSGT